MRSRSRDRARFGVGTSWLPTLLGSALYAWYRADKGITTVSGAVSAWADQSPNGRNLSQSSAPARPVYTTASGVVVLRMANAEWIGGSIGSLGAPCGVFLSAKFSANSNPGGAADFDYLYSLGHGAAGNGGLAGLARWRSDGGADDSKIYGVAYDTTPSVYYDGSGAHSTWKVYSHTHATSAPKHNLRINAASTSISDYTNTVSTGGLFTVGGYNTNSTPTVANFLSADVHEIVIVTGTLTSAQRAKLETYMGRRVGLSI